MWYLPILLCIKLCVFNNISCISINSYICTIILYNIQYIVNSDLDLDF